MVAIRRPPPPPEDCDAEVIDFPGVIGRPCEIRYGAGEVSVSVAGHIQAFHRDLTVSVLTPWGTTLRLKRYWWDTKDEPVTWQWPNAPDPFDPATFEPEWRDGKRLKPRAKKPFRGPWRPKDDPEPPKAA